MDKVVIKFQPDIPPLPGHLPVIDMKDPYDSTKRIVSYPKRDEKGGMFFELDIHVAAVVLSENEHIFKLWSPASIMVSRRGAFGVNEVVDIKSIDPACKPAEAIVADAGAAAQAFAEEQARKKAEKDKKKAEKAAVSAPPPVVAADSVADEFDEILGQGE